jgi:glycosyltransferase involved in cell wall biosynthesis
MSGSETGALGMTADRQTVCLNMIVKNEAPVIARCLASLRPIIDYWVIVDTGSTDGTQDQIRTLMADLPGELHERPWRDFAHNRTEALELARPHGEYVLIIDADDVLEFEPQFKMPALEADSYMLRIADTSIAYNRTQIVRAALPWRWRGVLHEFLTCEQARSSGRLEGLRLRRHHDGARRRDPQTYGRDAEILEAALQTESDPFMRSRYQFYLAQSYRDCGERDKALRAYLKRAELGFWVEEVFMSIYSAARLQEALGRPFDEVMTTYLRATETVPGRVEALHGASHYCRLAGRYKDGYEIAKRGLFRDAPEGLFVEPWIYEYGLLDEFAVNAYWIGRYQECLDACERILREGKCPEAQRPRIEANAAFARQNLDVGNAAVAAADAARAPRTPQKLKIAVYTIALNEAHHVDRWRSSANDADYLVVADTGSTDDTVERLSAAGVQIHRIAIRPWRFDDARNASLALVPADADVCISLDMDEFMMPDWRTVVESAWTPGITRLSYNFAPDYRGPGTPAHVIRKSKIHARWGYRWKRIIHEDLQPTDANEKQIAIDPTLIGQMQDLSKDRGKYLPMLQRAHEEDPHDSQICFWFARDLMYAGLNERSAEKYKAYLALPTSTWSDERSEAMRLLARVEPHRKREWLQKSVAEAPHRRELWLDLAEFFHAELNWLDLFWACINGIERTRRTGSYLDEPAAWGYRLYDLAALASSHLGLIDQAIKWGSTALDLVPNDQRLANNLAHYRSQALRRPA